MIMNPQCNATDNLFGGQMLAWIDEGAAMYASCQMQRDRLVTASISQVDFKLPIPKGWTCSVYCKTLKEGRTSLTIDVLVTRTSHSRRVEEEVTKTSIVFVAVDENFKPVPWKISK